MNGFRQPLTCPVSVHIIETENQWPKAVHEFARTFTTRDCNATKVGSEFNRALPGFTNSQESLEALPIDSIMRNAIIRCTKLSNTLSKHVAIERTVSHLGPDNKTSFLVHFMIILSETIPATQIHHDAPYALALHPCFAGEDGLKYCDKYGMATAVASQSAIQDTIQGNEASCQKTREVSRSEDIAMYSSSVGKSPTKTRINEPERHECICSCSNYDASTDSDVSTSIEDTIPSICPHLLVEEHSHSVFSLPIICLAPQHEIYSLVSSALFQRRACNVDGPLLALTFEPFDTTLQAVIGWLESDDVDSSIEVHIAHSSGSNESIGVFDIADARSAQELICLAVHRQELLTGPVYSRETTRPSYLPWRVDQAGHRAKAGSDSSCDLHDDIKRWLCTVHSSMDYSPSISPSISPLTFQEFPQTIETCTEEYLCMCKESRKACVIHGMQQDEYKEIAGEMIAITIPSDNSASSIAMNTQLYRTFSRLRPGDITSASRYICAYIVERLVTCGSWPPPPGPTSEACIKSVPWWELLAPYLDNLFGTFLLSDSMLKTLQVQIPERTTPRWDAVSYNIMQEHQQAFVYSLFDGTELTDWDGIRYSMAREQQLRWICQLSEAKNLSEADTRFFASIFGDIMRISEQAQLAEEKDRNEAEHRLNWDSIAQLVLGRNGVESSVVYLLERQIPLSRNLYFDAMASIDKEPADGSSHRHKIGPIGASFQRMQSATFGMQRDAPSIDFTLPAAEHIPDAGKFLLDAASKYSSDAWRSISSAHGFQESTEKVNNAIRRLDRAWFLPESIRSRVLKEPLTTTCDAVACIQVPDFFRNLDDKGVKRVDKFSIVNVGLQSKISQVNMEQLPLPYPTTSNARGLIFPVFFVSHKKAGGSLTQAMGQARNYLTSSVRYLAAIGIVNFPVFCLVTHAARGVVISAYGEPQPMHRPNGTWNQLNRYTTVRVQDSNCPSFDLGDRYEAAKFACFLMQLHSQHGTELLRHFQSSPSATQSTPTTSPTQQPALSSIEKVFRETWQSGKREPSLDWTMEHQVNEPYFSRAKEEYQIQKGNLECYMRDQQAKSEEVTAEEMPAKLPLEPLDETRKQWEDLKLRTKQREEAVLSFDFPSRQILSEPSES